MKTKRDRFNLFGKRWFMLLLSFMVSAASFAMSDQSPAAVRGRVIDSNGEALIGVSVLVRGTQKGTITDSGGNFSIPGVSVGSVLEFSYIGFVKTDKKFDGKEMTVIMLEDNTSLDEVEIVAFGTQKKESVIGAITTIAPAELKVPSSNLTTSFAGRMAGMIFF